MPSNVKIAMLIFLCLTGMTFYAFTMKKQFYPTMVYLSKSGAAIAACYAEALALALILSTILRKIFFGELRPIESEQLTERSWYALTETCLAFTIFKEETIPTFVFLFALLIFMKTFHWLTNERVDLIERSVVLSHLFHSRIIAVFFILGAIDTSFITYSYQQVMAKGPSIQVVFGFEYCILLTMLLDNVIKYIFYLHGLFDYSSSDSRAVGLMYVSVIMNSVKLLLYSVFFFLMVEMFTFPLFVVRPMYFALKSFKKSVMNVLMARKAMKYLNTFYPDVTPSDLTLHDNSCIICREELTLSSKKLPCNHIFHTACLRSWFQRQQTCPTCRFAVLDVPQSVQLERMRDSRKVDASTQTERQSNFNGSCTPTCFLRTHNSTSVPEAPTITVPLTNVSGQEVADVEIDGLDRLILRIDIPDLHQVLESATTTEHSSPAWRTVRIERVYVLKEIPPNDEANVNC